MSLCYHLTIPPSPLAGCDAVVQEVQALQGRFGGRISHLYPGRQPGTRFPRRLWGMMRGPALCWMERQIKVHHLYNPDPYPFAVLRFLRRPVIYTVSAGVQPGDRANAQRLARRVQTLVVATAAEQSLLRRWQVDNVAVVRPGISLAHFTSAPPPVGLPPTLLMGSAPWTREQFRTKGVDALLDLAQHWPELHLIFLWRGILYAEMMQRVHALGLDDRVEIINEQVDVNAVLVRVHAAIILATEDALIRSYPHSLLEAMASGRPVIVSQRVPIAMDVDGAQCGVVVETLEPAVLRAALNTVLADYAAYSQRALVLVLGFSQQRLLDDYAEIYRHAGVC